MADEDPRSGELGTANYGWLKPNVGDTDDAWGGMLNADLDGIDSTVKSVSNVANAALPIAGGTLTGPVLAAADPTAALGLATKQYVDAMGARQNRNRLINGAMNIDQYNSHSSVAMPTGLFFCCDRWKGSVAQAGKLNAGALLVAAPQPFAYYLRLAVTASYTPAAGDVFTFFQRLAWGHTADWAWGVANAQPVTLSFWVTAGTGGAGTYSGSIRNAAANRSYVFTFPVQANVWTPVSITIPGDVTGTWLQADPNAVAVDLLFDLGSGSTYRSTAGSWQAGNFIGATGAQQFVTQAVNNILNFANIQLEVGSQATPFDWKPPAAELAECKRYYQVGNMQAAGYGSAGGALAAASILAFPVSMRGTPALTPNWTTQINCTGTMTTQGVGYYQVYVTATAAGNTNGAGTFTASAEI